MHVVFGGHLGVDTMHLLAEVLDLYSALPRRYIIAKKTKKQTPFYRASVEELWLF